MTLVEVKCLEWLKMRCLCPVLKANTCSYLFLNVVKCCRKALRWFDCNMFVDRDTTLYFDMETLCQSVGHGHSPKFSHKYMFIYVYFPDYMDNLT